MCLCSLFCSANCDEKPTEVEPLVDSDSHSVLHNVSETSSWQIGIAAQGSGGGGPKNRSETAGGSHTLPLCHSPPDFVCGTSNVARLGVVRLKMFLPQMFCQDGTLI